MNTPLHCLLVLDSEADALLVLRQLRDGGYAVTSERVDTFETMQTALERGAWDIVICDFSLARFRAAAALELIRTAGLELPLLVVSDTAREEQIVEAMKAGAHDYLTKDRLVRLASAVDRELREVVERRKRKRAESALRVQGAALEAAANAIVITDRDGTIVWVNASFTTLTGYTLAEAVGRNPRELVKSGQQESAHYQNLWETILAGRVWHGELVNRRKDGSLYPEEQTITPVRNASGAIAHFIAIKQDLTERKRAEAESRESEERYRLFFENNPLPMWLYDVATLRFLAVNESAVQSYGYTREEFLGMTIAPIHQPEDIPALMKIVEEGPDESRRSSAYRHRRKDGTVIHVEVFSHPLTFEGRAARFVLATDITEKILLEEKFLRAQRLESLGMLASGIAHDLNNMLAPIIFAAPMLRENAHTPRDLKILATLERSAERGAGLVKQILAFAHGTVGDPRLTQVKHIARDVIGLVEETFPKSIRLEHQIPSDTWPVIANPSQLHQVLVNLCVNARDAMPRGGTLQINAANRRLGSAEARAIPGARPGAWLVLEIIDSGTGIPADVLPRIWEPFFTTKEPGKGTGLGLSTVRGIVAGHLGFIELETVAGKGTTFRIFLPAAETEAPRAAASAGSSPFPRGHGEVILVVDDDAAIRDMIAAILGRHGFRVVTCGDGVEAVTYFTANSVQVAVVITDVDMPNLGGAALAQALRRQQPEVLLLTISGLADGGPAGADIQAAREFTNAFLLKPFTADELLASVHHLLHPPENP